MLYIRTGIVFIKIMIDVRNIDLLKRVTWKMVLNVEGYCFPVFHESAKKLILIIQGVRIKRIC